MVYECLSDYKFYLYRDMIEDPTLDGHAEGSVIVLQIDADSAYAPAEQQYQRIAKRLIGPQGRKLVDRPIPLGWTPITIDVPAPDESLGPKQPVHEAFYAGLVRGNGDGSIDANRCKFMVVRYSPISSSAIESVEVAENCCVSATFDAYLNRYRLTIKCENVVRKR